MFGEVSYLSLGRSQALSPSSHWSVRHTKIVVMKCLDIVVRDITHIPVNWDTGRCGFCIAVPLFNIGCNLRQMRRPRHITHA